MALLQAGAPIGGAKLWYDRGKQRFFLLVSLTLQTPDPTPEGQRQVIGVDVGQRSLATVATLDNGAQFSSGKEIRSKADHYARVQKRLQRKGTRSATRRRIALGQRERRLKLNTNHTISKRILDTHPHACIGLEELSGIRDRTKRKHGKKATKRQRRANRHASTWAFAELHGLLAYKAVLVGSLCIKVDADYTSQTCPRCGYTSRQNRPGQGLLFVCQQCGYTLHADLVGARNIALRTLVIRHDWVATGQLSDAPEGQTAKPKRRASPGMPNCGGVWPQAPCLSSGVLTIKMLEAYLVVPAFGLLYLLAAPRRLRTRLWHLAVAGVLMAVISLSWAAVVDMTPAAQRPYVGSSQNNSEISLALGYNGLQRLEGNSGAGPGGRGAAGGGGIPRWLSATIGRLRRSWWQ